MNSKEKQHLYFCTMVKSKKAKRPITFKTLFEFLLQEFSQNWKISKFLLDSSNLVPFIFFKKACIMSHTNEIINEIISFNHKVFIIKSKTFLNLKLLKVF